MKTAVEMLLLAGVVPERLYCFQHQDWYSYVLSTVACTRPPFPLELSKFLKSLVINDPSVEGFGGLAHSSIGNNKSVFLEFSNKWSKEFDVFDVRTRLPTHSCSHRTLGFKIPNNRLSPRSFGLKCRMFMRCSSKALPSTSLSCEAATAGITAHHTPTRCRRRLGSARICGALFKPLRASALRLSGIIGTLGSFKSPTLCPRVH